MTSDPASAAPFFTVVMATFGRGRHIVPSIRSVLQQQYADYELVVVGDHCEDDTADVVAGFAPQGVRWTNLPKRCGSQSAPNNAGIAAARGQVIAYIGHDDIWEPTHLRDLARLFAEDSHLNFGVAGAIFHLPNGIPGSQITGLFDDDKAKHIHFFPPSSFAHRKAVCDVIGQWRMPLDIVAPVDTDFLLRAAKVDMKFASTGKLTVHKFAAGHRYLSYMQQESHEQEVMLTCLSGANHADRIATIVADSHRLKTFMCIRHRSLVRYGPGDLARQNAARKGLLEAKVKPFGLGVSLRQRPAHCSLDWHDHPKHGIRWTRQNPKPRFLLPYSGGSDIGLRFVVVHPDRSALVPIALLCNGNPIIAVPGWRRRGLRYWRATYHAVVSLKPVAASIIEFHLTSAQAPLPQKRGIGLGAMRLIQPFTGLGFLQHLQWFLRQVKITIWRDRLR